MLEINGRKKPVSAKVITCMLYFRTFMTHAITRGHTTQDILLALGCTKATQFRQIHCLVRGTYLLFCIQCQKTLKTLKTGHLG